MDAVVAMQVETTCRESFFGSDIWQTWHKINKVGQRVQIRGEYVFFV